MINRNILPSAKPVINPTLNKLRVKRIEVLNYNGDPELELDGLISTDGYLFDWPRDKQMKLVGIYFNGVLQPVTQYSYNNLTGKITWVVDTDLINPEGMNILIQII